MQVQSFVPSASVVAASEVDRVDANEEKFIGVEISAGYFGKYIWRGQNVSDDPVNRIVQSRIGMGTIGETYLVGKNQSKISFRSNLLTMGNGTYVVGHEIHTEYIDKVLSDGKQNFQHVYTDRTGRLVLVAADTLEANG